MRGERYKFYFLVLFIAFFMLIKIYSTPLQQTVKVSLLKQNGQIKNLSTVKNIKKVIHFTIEGIEFPENDQLYYKNTGNLGYKEDFFLILESTMDVKKSDNYQFTVTSDDGFQLKIDNKIVCEYSAVRGMKETFCQQLKISQGQHKLRLEYFQGYGRLGLIAEYALYDKKLKTTNQEKRLIGQNSPFLHFLPLFPSTTR